MAVRDAVVQVLDDEDVMRLEPGRRTPADEYGPEALDLTTLFLIDGVVTFEHVELCWLHRFSERLDPHRASAISSRATTAAWRAFYRPDDHASPCRLRATADTTRISPSRHAPASIGHFSPAPPS